MGKSDYLSETHKQVDSSSPAAQSHADRVAALSLASDFDQLQKVLQECLNNLQSSEADRNQLQNAIAAVERGRRLSDQLLGLIDSQS